MRLINIKTLQLETFDNWDTVPPYAILSHTWEDGEVLFHDISTDLSKEKKGWSKILGSCMEAEKLGIFYLWVDTCCIFKESSAELSERVSTQCSLGIAMQEFALHTWVTSTRRTTKGCLTNRGGGR